MTINTPPIGHDHLFVVMSVIITKPMLNVDQIRIFYSSKFQQEDTMVGGPLADMLKLHSIWDLVSFRAKQQELGAVFSFTPFSAGIWVNCLRVRGG